MNSKETNSGDAPQHRGLFVQHPLVLWTGWKWDGEEPGEASTALGDARGCGWEKRKKNPFLFHPHCFRARHRENSKNSV